MIKMALHQRFFEAAKLDFEVAKGLTEKGLYQPALYHLQQTYEKCIKSYFIFKEVNVNYTPESTVHKNIRILDHNTQESTITLLKDMADIEKRVCKSRLPNLSDSHQRQTVQNVINVIDNYKVSIDRAMQALNLKTNYINNVRKYSQYVTSKYNYHQNSITAISKQPSKTFLHIISCMINLYPCLYKMESISRYPLKEFSYDNLNLLSNQKDSCQKIIEILDELFSLVSNDLK